MAPSTAVKLNNQNIALLRKAEQSQNAVKIPSFDRNGVKEGIVHVGVGGFHRAHLAVYVDELMGQFGLRDWAICGVGLQPFDAGMRDALVPQDCLYTVIERAATGSSARVIGSINSFLYALDNPEAVIAKMAHPDTHIVSMTITESGYYYNENTHELELEHPDIVADLASDLAKPRTTFGYLFAALARRHEAGLRPFTVLSCDNMQKNGTITRNMLLTFARHRDPKIAEWIEKLGGFPNSMVDRITPRTGEIDKTNLAETFGIQDAWPVVTEPFMQWVVEDRFADGRPPFEKVGVQVVSDVSDVEKFECHKLRLLNASHTAMSYAAFLGGFEYVHQVLENPLFHNYIYNMMHKEVKPLLPAIPGVDIDEYCNTLLERFANPTIMDQITRLTLNGSGKLPQFIMPSIAEQIMHGDRNFRRLTFCVASWFRYLNGVDEQGKPFFIDDPMAEDLKARAIKGGEKPFPLLDVKSLFGDDLRGDKVFVDELTNAMESLHRDGALATLAKYVD
ncbi:mannitol 2-dehydrogenase [Coleophoma cylindrospora]|uniref:Mannitol 2-dehydrogenase n=1 Tax=Coleophoma cylindrospora TaxID=1849047 RepID=A0A3D8QKX1_9HELO|nr:mannitol 2-dehydrogenase [Coleophoma cylindrospora]